MYRFSFLIILIFSFAIISCQSNKNMTSENAEVVFSLKTTPCIGECPVYELNLYGDKTLVFEGKEHTSLEGSHKKELSDEQFDKLMGIVETANWDNLEPSYKSNMNNSPTQNFSYNRNGLSKNVSKEGNEPEELSNMSKLILTFIEEDVFN
ncbi:MAG: DUF6438 domain-containing protein [Bacteroidota bacterium]